MELHIWTSEAQIEVGKVLWLTDPCVLSDWCRGSLRKMSEMLQWNVKPRYIQRRNILAWWGDPTLLGTWHSANTSPPNHPQLLTVLSESEEGERKKSENGTLKSIWDSFTAITLYKHPHAVLYLTTPSLSLSLSVSNTHAHTSNPLHKLFLPASATSKGVQFTVLHEVLTWQSTNTSRYAFEVEKEFSHIAVSTVSLSQAMKWDRVWCQTVCQCLQKNGLKLWTLHYAKQSCKYALMV